MRSRSIQLMPAVLVATLARLRAGAWNRPSVQATPATRERSQRKQAWKQSRKAQETTTCFRAASGARCI